MRILTIVGARPQFVKAAVVSRALRETSNRHEILVHTGQHFDENMSDVFFTEMDIPRPDHHLGVAGGNHGEQTGRMLERIEQVLISEKPDWVLVYGDTNSTLAGALAAAKSHVPVAHVEAGLRSYNRRMPEEINRVLTDHAANLLLPPTQTAVDNLQREGIAAEKVRLVGDVMLDAALYYGDRAESASTVLNTLGLTRGEYVLATIHRAENTDDVERLTAILQGLALVAAERPVVLPLHPRTAGAVRRSALEQIARPITMIDPVGYFDMIMLEKNAAVIATDSGGVQKEAYFYQVPCVTLRDETEWVELVEHGWNTLISPTDPNLIQQAIKAATGRRGSPGQLYGDGTAARKVSELLT